MFPRPCAVNRFCLLVATEYNDYFNGEDTILNRNISDCLKSPVAAGFAAVAVLGPAACGSFDPSPKPPLTPSSAKSSAPAKVEITLDNAQPVKLYDSPGKGQHQVGTYTLGSFIEPDCRTKGLEVASTTPPYDSSNEWLVFNPDALKRAKYTVYIARVSTTQAIVDIPPCLEPSKSP
jgi:hypothetical protein